MRLYFKPGACSLASRIVLIELGQAFEAIRVDTDAGLTEDGRDYRAVNPRGYVPALELKDGRVVTENPAVLQYLADLQPDRLAPAAGSWDRVRLQEALSFISSELHKAFSPFFHGEAQGERRAPAEALLKRRLGEVEQMLGQESPYLLGDRMSVADIYLFVVLNWTGFIGFSLQGWPRLYDLMSRMGAHASVRAALLQEGLLKDAA
ncbi:glutathione binding-like protein [Brevundimonas diminuta]|uniref:glutathione binding-like protein n=1 Tax=Brevundimonas diminuta TaxID=293 RepID=UPI000207F130|nr:glutathione binding-like protein [Brevundimonas diminuta]EGF94095.1 glutathione S-transferase [Brevundimonas diminuta ATCC 11568]OWR20299.1 glutathione S-transferase [Brevundimonas diminuta]WQE43956.1 glutathione S-transferase C-terminal domain-containing protein [Brevundimonas diminuta]SUW16446.1 Glutathione S-transferase [Brevundimonas diminuta]